MAPRSPNLNPCDLFLSAYMKEEVQRVEPGCAAEVKQLIREFLASTDEGLLQRVTSQFRSPVIRCIAVCGGVFELMCRYVIKI